MSTGSGQHKSVGVFGQTALLFKKSFLLKIRQEPKKLAGEILIPVLYLVLLCVLVTLQKVEILKEVTTEPAKISDVLKSLPGMPVHVVPDTQEVQNLTNVMNSILTRRSYPSLTYKFLPDESSLLQAYNSHMVSMAIVFTSSAQVVKFTDYAIRIDGAAIPGVTDRKVGLETCRDTTVDESRVTCPVNGYYNSNFLALQFLVDQADLEMKNKKQFDLKVTLANYPKAEYNAGIPTSLRVIIPLYLVIPLSQFINNLLVLVVTEKEDKIKDGLRMIGVSDSAYWMSWFGVYSIMSFIFSLLFTIVMYSFKVLANLNPLILFLLFFFFGLSVITLGFAITPFFHKPKTAGIVGTLVLQFTSLLFLLQTFVVSSSGAVLIPLRLISSLAFTTALDVASAHEYTGGIGWSDLRFGGRGEGVLISFIFLIFDLIFYALLAMYLDNVIPNQFGVRKHPLFCFMPSFWIGKAKKVRYGEDGQLINEGPNGGSDHDDLVEVGDDIEPISPNLVGKEAIRIRHIKKTYFPSWTQRGGVTVHAVKDISLNIYEGQITAILGRNGAGKSTLFNMLIGLVTPTSGGSVVFGLDISDPYDMAKLRKMTGVCLQYDLHFHALTVEEHLRFYGELRGLDKADLDSQINTILTDLRLKEKRNTHASKLSGGQKRKLSVGIALIGDPKIILLDEPTAGVDPVSRRHLWSLLQRNKTGKVILLTTHFMDEADILADRKVIIHDGEMKCIGSSLFLKTRFGVGYYLTVEMNDRNVSTTECDEIIKKWIPSAVDSKKVVSNEVKYSLPHSEVASFASLFASLENIDEAGPAGIKSYGVSLTTLEEVFLKISTDAVEQAEHGNSEHPNPNSENYGASDEQNLIGDFGEIKIKPAAVFWAMCKLRIRRLYRSPQAVFFMVFMPVILAAIGLYLVKTTGNRSHEETLILSRPKGIYDNSERHVALFEGASKHTNFSASLSDLGFIVHGEGEWDGKFATLLNVNQPHGTMAALKLSGTADDISGIQLLINGTFVHSTPIMLAAIHQHFEKEKPSDLKISSRPFVSQTTAGFDVTSFFVVFLLGPSFVFTSVGMVLEIVYDREIKARNHLRVNGLTFRMYFFSVFIVFGFLAVLVTLMQLSLVGIFNVEAFMNPYAFTVTLVLLLLYIPPSLFFSAAFSYFFDRMESAQSVFSQIASWSGTISSIIIIVLEAVKVKASIILIVHTALCIVNIFYIPFAVFYYVNKQYLQCSINRTCGSQDFSNYSGSEFYVMFLAMLGQIPAFLLLLLVADVLKNGGSVKSTLRSVFHFKKVAASTHEAREVRPRPSRTLSLSSGSEVDEDVTNETIRVNDYFSQPTSNPACVVAVQGVIKYFKVEIGEGKSKKKIYKNVVNKLSLMVEEGEVFGLLGHNGAGKTTAMKLITAEESPNVGNVRLCGYDIQSNMSDAFIHLGYCPQHDVLWENITLREHLELYGAIRGILPENRQRLVNHFLFGLKIKEHSEKRASDLSGGTKRKLSYALSMLGAPRVVLLDEPSTGMDPQSKRFLWNTILGTFKDSRGAMLTTHSMEEADALCTRIAIMVKGSLLCIGSPQHLKTKFGAGYTLEIKLKTSIHDDTINDEVHTLSSPPEPSSSDEAPFAFVLRNFPGAFLSESFGNRATFSVPTSSIQSISTTFTLLEDLKQKEEIEEYSFSQTTLEQVFLGFAKDNEDNEDE